MSEFLKCDAAGCEHVETVGSITADLVGKPCPVCGSSLLTQEDYQNWQPFQALFQALGQLKAAGSNNVEAFIKVGLHGKKTTIEIERKNEV